MKLALAIALAVVCAGSLAARSTRAPRPLAPCEVQAYAAIDGHLRARLPRLAR